MKKIAIDIVIIPSEKVLDKIIKINNYESKNGNAIGPLGKTDFIPHISLAMGTMDTANMKPLSKSVEKICKKFDPFTINLNKLDYKVKKDGTKYYAVKVQNNPDLQKLHEHLMNTSAPYLKYKATKKEYYSLKNEAVKDPSWINEFKDSHSFKNFNPHITLRCKAITKKFRPMSFRASTIAIFHAGTSVTCRKLLFKTTLK